VRARIAWAIVALTVVASILDTVFTAAYRSLLSEATWADHGWPLAPVANVGCALMGALIVSRSPRHPIGWLLCVASLLSVTLAAEAYSVWVLDGDGPGPTSWGHLAAWAGPLLGWPAFTAFVVVFLIAPDGHLATPRWRWAVWVTMAGLILHILGTLTTPPGDFVYGQRDSSHAITAPLLTVGYLLITLGLIASAVSLVVRLRRSRDDERRQLLWIASSAAFLALGVVVILVVPRMTGVEGTWLAGLPLRLAQVAVPLCVAVAVLRHRLLEIDLIVNRALVLALATGLVAVGYVFVVVTVGLAVGEGTGGFWPSLLATAVVALAFQPLRRRVVGVADRLAFGAAAAPYEALADFSRRLGESPDPSTLLPSVADAAGHAVNASWVVVVLNVGVGPDLTAVWPPLAADDLTASRVEMPVLDQGERLGSITVAMPPGRPLRPREQRLLADLADQAGLAFRNARLTAELSGEVQQLDRRTRELSESRRRLISADDEERRRLERAIARQVILHLDPLPSRLQELSSSGSHASNGLDASLLVPLVEALNTALEALREITRGVFPAQLARSGLPTALSSLLTRTANGQRLVVEDSAARRRFAPRVEAATYFCVAEATRALGDPVLVMLEVDDGQLRVVVSGCDHGDLPLGHIRDRVEAAGGSMAVSTDDRHTVIETRLPAPHPVPASS
jgi:signal transduction histidine kinase